MPWQSNATSTGRHGSYIDITLHTASKACPKLLILLQYLINEPLYSWPTQTPSHRQRGNYTTQLWSNLGGEKIPYILIMKRPSTLLSRTATQRHTKQQRLHEEVTFFWEILDRLEKTFYCLFEAQYESGTLGVTHGRPLVTYSHLQDDRARM